MVRARTTEPAAADPCTAYARDVVAGEIVAGRLVRLAAERHLRDLETGPARGLKWDPAAAAKVLGFFALLQLPSGGPFKLHPSQQFIVGCLFGWKKADGTRRFVTAYIEQGKGNGKTPLAAGIGLYGLWMDGEGSAEVYCAATKEEQATICFRDAQRILNNTPGLKRRFEVGKRNIAHLASGSFMRPLASGGGQSGPRPSVALVDELHEHPTDEVIGILRAGFKFRTQPLLLAITNSGFDRASVCWVYREYSEKVLKGVLEDDTWFAYVCGLDPCKTHLEEGQMQPVEGCKDCDDWRDEKVWQKANPCLGSIIRHDYLRREVAGAIGRPTEEGRVKRLNFCIWTESETAWLPAELWSRGAGPLNVEALRGRECFGGLDVASKTDVAAWVLCVPGVPEAGHYALLCHFWIPRKGAEERSTKDNVPWLVWERQGLVALTPGDVIDLDRIERQVKEDNDTYYLREVAFDPWNAQQMATHLQAEGIEVVEFGQTLKNFNEPSKTFEALLKEGKLHHGSNAVLDWMAGNVVVYADANGNIRPLKPEHHSPKKVDGITAACMALGRALLADAGSWGGSLLD